MKIYLDPEKFTTIAQQRFVIEIVKDAHTDMVWWKNADSTAAICSRMGISTHYVTKMLKQLKKSGILLNSYRSMYTVNPLSLIIKE